MNKHSLTAILVGLGLSFGLYYIWFLAQQREMGSPQLPETVARSAENPSATSTVSSAQGAVSIEARIASTHLSAGATRTHVLLHARTGDSATRTVRVPSNVVLVIDRSGSMAGAWIENAKLSAEHVLDSLQDGDRIALISYATDAQIDYPSTLLNSSSRSAVRNTIRNLRVGGGTCISCGLTMGQAQLSKGQAESGVSRVILFSDGQANTGIVDLDQLASLARDIERSGSTVSSVGVGLDYNESLMMQLAVSGNGNHYFVENPTQLASILKEEMNSLQQLVAKRVVATFELAEGVTFIKGYDRPFEVEGRRVFVSLGDMPASSERTALFEVSLPAGPEGMRMLSTLSVGYEDLVASKAQHVEHSLSYIATSDLESINRGVDHVVLARLEQAKLADTLAEANELIRNGDVEQAKSTVRKQIQLSRDNNMVYGSTNLNLQIEILEEAAGEMDAPAMATGKGRSAGVKKNVERQRSILY
ncbi:MAG: VWA domain-containing protein [Myxococcota bacterium]|jgi:Ca-activated chloride channel family protein|nr:VWA domain-containing protein [Myxococcota bacterium]